VAHSIRAYRAIRPPGRRVVISRPAASHVTPTRPTRPRIAIVTPVYPNSAEPLRGIFTYRAALALQKWAQMEVYCLLAAYPRTPLLRSRQRRYPRVDPAFRTPGVPVRYVQYPALPVVSRVLNAHTAARWLRPHLQRDPPDLVLAYWVHPEGTAALRVGRMLGIPVIIKALGTDLRLIADPLARRAIRQTLRDASFVVTVSEDLSRRALALGAAPGRVKTILNGCDPAVFHVASRADARAELGVAEEAELVVFVGHLIAQKGVPELLGAITRLASSHPWLQLAVIGEGPLEQELQRRVLEPPLRGRVRLLGRQDPSAVARWLAASNLLCLPSHSEGCPNVVLEALFSGRPVVASDVGGIPELVDESCAVLTKVQDEADLADGLARALARPWDERAIAAARGRSWDDATRELFEVCSAVLATRRTA
jgi:glycosyltransferase involved in cell wall biosynthesis